MPVLIRPRPRDSHPCTSTSPLRTWRRRNRSRRQGHDQHVAETPNTSARPRIRPVTVASAVRFITHIQTEAKTGSPRPFRPAVPGPHGTGRGLRPAGWRHAGRIDVGDHHVDRTVPGERGQHRPDQGGQFGKLDRPPGPDLHGHPAAADHDALNFAARQVGGDLAELAAVKPRQRPRIPGTAAATASISMPSITAGPGMLSPGGRVMPRGWGRCPGRRRWGGRRHPRRY